MTRSREIIERELEYERGALKNNALSKCMFCSEKEKNDQYTTQGTYVSTKPDIVIKDGNTDLFVIELKQLNMPFDARKEAQLLSYLKQLHNDVGIFICNKIYIYDYDYGRSNEEQDRAEIEFEVDNPDGVKFIEMFSKNAFNKSVVENFVQKQAESVKKVKMIKKELTSDLTIDLLKNYFTDKYGATEFEQAIADFNITIATKNVSSGTFSSPPSSIAISRKVIRSIAPQSSSAKSIGDTISKSEAVVLCHSNGLDISKNMTFAKRSIVNEFYANPHIDRLAHDWWLILNDQHKNELHILLVPANSLSANQLVVRKDIPYKIDLHIRCDDDTFTDKRSGIKFEAWLMKVIKY
ncbi:MAG: hypothetical protein LBD23_06115 [Oscillospiraceae bacterium]|jgi:hypothetical protein|nr:hypothetical protein [Oscillospiraceae bacterium]